MNGEELMSVDEFAERIKARYPKYADEDNYQLALRMVDVFDQYKGQVDFKKKEEERLSQGLSAQPDQSSVSASSVEPSASSTAEPDQVVPPSGATIEDRRNRAAMLRQVRQEREAAEASSTDPNQSRINEANQSLARLEEQKAVMDPSIYNQQREELNKELSGLTGGSQYTGYLPTEAEAREAKAEDNRKIVTGETRVLVDERFKTDLDEELGNTRVLQNNGIKREGYTAQVNNETASAFGLGRGVVGFKGITQSAERRDDNTWTGEYVDTPGFVYDRDDLLDRENSADFYRVGKNGQLVANGTAEILELQTRLIDEKRKELLDSPESKKKNQEIFLDLQSKEGKYTPLSGLFKSTMSKEEVNSLLSQYNLGSIDDYFFNTKEESDKSYLDVRKRIFHSQYESSGKQMVALIGGMDPINHEAARVDEFNIEERFLNAVLVRGIDDAYTAEGGIVDQLKGRSEELFSEIITEDDGFKEFYSDYMFSEYGVGLDLDEDRKYNDKAWHEEMSLAFGAGLLNPGYGLQQVARSAAALFSGGIDEEEEEELKRFRDARNSQLAYVQSQATTYTRNMSESLADGNYSDFFQQLGNNVASSAPILALATASGGLGTAGLLTSSLLIGTSSAGSTYLTVRDTDYFKDNPEQALKYSLISGGAEFAGTLATGGLSMGMRALGATRGTAARLAERTARSKFKLNLAKEAGSKAASRQAATRYYKDFLKQYAFSKGVTIGGEYLDESLTSLIQNYSEKSFQTGYVDENGQYVAPEEFNFFEALEEAHEAGLVGAASGIGVSAIGSRRDKARAAANARAHKSRYARRRSVTAGINDINNQIKEFNEAVQRGERPDLDINALQKKKNKLIQEELKLSLQEQVFYERLGMESPEALDAVSELDLQIEALAVKYGKEASVDAKKKMKDDMGKLLDQRQQVLDGFESLRSKKLGGDESLKLLQSTLESGLEDAAEDLEIKEMALEALENDIRDPNKPEVSPESLERAKANVDQARAKKESLESALDQSSNFKKRRDEILNGRSEDQLSDLEKSELEVVDNQAVGLFSGYTSSEALSDIIPNINEVVPQGSVLDAAKNTDDLPPVEDGSSSKKSTFTVSDFTQAAKDAADDTDDITIFGAGGMSSTTTEGPISSNADEVSFFNKVVSDLSSMGIQVIVVNDSGQAKLADKNGSDVLGKDGAAQYLVDSDGNEVIIINPQKVQSLQVSESSAGVRGKTIAETIGEEFLHGMISNQFGNIAYQNQLEILNKAFQIIQSSGDQAAIDRVIAKVATYGGENSLIVFDGKEFKMSEGAKSSADESGNLPEDIKNEFARTAEEGFVEATTIYGETGKAGSKGFKEAVRSLVQYIASRFGKKIEFAVSNADDAVRVMGNYANYRKRNSTSAERKAAPSKSDGSSQMESKGLYPSQLKTGENGKVRVYFDQTNYKYFRDGSAKDIGTYETYLDFNDHRHFQNWWRLQKRTPNKAQGRGFKSDDYMDFRQDDNPINMDSIRIFDGKSRSSRGLDQIDRIKRRGNSAVTQGIINAGSKAGIESKMRTLVFQLEDGTIAKRILSEEIRGYEEGRVGQDDFSKQRYAENLGALNALEQAQIDYIERSRAYVNSERNKKGLPPIQFRFRDDDPSTRRSSALNLDLATTLGEAQLNLNFEEFIEARNEALCGKSGTCDLSDQVSTREFLQEQAMAISGIKITDSQKVRAEKGARAQATVLAKVLQYPELRQELFGDYDPANFHEDYTKKVDEFATQLIEDGDALSVGNDKQTISTLVHLVASVTSQQNEAAPNLLAAQSIVHKALTTLDDRYTPNGKPMVFPQQIINKLMDNNTGDEYAMDLGFIPGTVAKTVAGQLQKINSMLAGVDLSGSKNEFFSNGRMAVPADLSSYSADGFRINADALMSYLSQQGGDKNGKSTNYRAQAIFGAKIGPFAMNLMGNLDVITVDGRVTEAWQLFTGNGLTPDIQLARHANKIASITGIALENGDVTANHLDALYELGHPMVDGRLAPRSEMSDEQKAANSLYKTVVSPSASAPSLVLDPTSDSKRNGVIDFVKGVANELGVPNAVAMQLIFADQQTFTGGVAPTASRYMGFAEPMDVITSQRLYKMDNASAREVRRMADERRKTVHGNLFETYKKYNQPPSPLVYSEAQQIAFEELFPVTSIVRPSINSQDATESDVYVERQQTDASMRVSDTMIQESVLGNESLRDVPTNFDAVDEGANVSVTMNTDTNVPVLEVRSSKGLDVALGAVTLRNASFSVNGDSVKNAVSFGSNSSSPISISGEYASGSLAKTDLNGVKAVFNPFNGSLAVTDVKGRPIKSAEEATVIGNEIFLRGKIEYGDVSEYTQPSVPSGKKRHFTKEEYAENLDKFIAYSDLQLSVSYASRKQAKAAFDNLSDQAFANLQASEVAKATLEGVQRESRGLRLRATAGKGARTFESQRSKIINNMENYISPQKIKQIGKDYETLTAPELINIAHGAGLNALAAYNDDTGVLAGAELIRRSVLQGNEDEIPAILEQLSKAGTTAGRVLRQLRELKGVNPDAMYEMIMSMIEKKGNTISDSQKARLKNMCADSIKLKLEYDQLYKDAMNGKDVESQLKAKIKELKSNERELGTFTSTTIERSVGDIGTALIKGNLLTPISQVTNVGANMVNALGDIFVDALSLPLEKVMNMFGAESNVKRNYSLNAFAYGVMKGMSGLVEASKQVLTGQESDVTEWRMQRGFTPFRTLMAVLGKGDLPISDSRAKTVRNRAKMLLEASAGVPAETMFRLLSLGDTPFRRYKEGMELYRLGRNQGLRGDDLKRFMKYPTKRALEQAVEEGKKLTFQADTTASLAVEEGVRMMESLIGKGVSGISGGFIDGEATGRYIMATLIPYRKTPANILHETLTFMSPIYGGARAVKALRNGDARSASQHVAKVFIGSMVQNVGLMLIKEGLINGELGYGGDEEEKRRNISYGEFPPHSVNVSGIKRWINGEDPSPQPDDQFTSYNRLGVFGVLLGATTHGTEKADLENREYGDFGEFMHHSLTDMFGVGNGSAAANMLDQSFLSGMDGLLQVLTSVDPSDWERSVERLMGSVFQAASATVLPNTLTSLHRSQREYMPDKRVTKDMSFSERVMYQMEYTIKDRTFNTTEYPIKVDWKGDPIKQNPRNSDPYLFQLLDITQTKMADSDPLGMEIYRLGQSTGELSEIVGTPKYAKKEALSVPNPPTSKAVNRAIKRAENATGIKFTFLEDEKFTSKNIYLNTTQLNELMKISGKERYLMGMEVIGSDSYRSSNDDEKSGMLNAVDSKFVKALSLSDDKLYLRNYSIELLKMFQEIYEEEIDGGEE